MRVVLPEPAIPVRACAQKDGKGKSNAFAGMKLNAMSNDGVLDADHSLQSQPDARCPRLSVLVHAKQELQPCMAVVGVGSRWREALAYDNNDDRLRT